MGTRVKRWNDERLGHDGSMGMDRRWRGAGATWDAGRRDGIDDLGGTDE